jgi:hypothetical protein
LAITVVKAMTESETSTQSSAHPQAPDSATRGAPILSDRQAKALHVAKDAICHAEVALVFGRPVSNALIAQVRRGLSRFPGGGRAGDLEPSLSMAEIVARAGLMLYRAKAVPAVRDELHPRPGPHGHGKRHRLRYPNYQRYIDKLRKRKRTLSLRATQPSPPAQPSPPHFSQ